MTVRKFVIMLNSLLQMHLKLLQKKSIQKTAEATSDLIGNKIADKITKAIKASPWNNSETDEEEILTEKYISPELRQKIIDGIRLKEGFW